MARKPSDPPYVIVELIRNIFRSSNIIFAAILPTQRFESSFLTVQYADHGSNRVL
jgi:hypothetical protein